MEGGSIADVISARRLAGADLMRARYGSDLPCVDMVTYCVGMVTRNVSFYKWTSMPTREEFVPGQVMERLRGAIARDADFALTESDDVTTAVSVIEPGGENEPTKLQLLALRGVEHRPSQWRPGGKLEPLPLLDGDYPADVSYFTIWPNGYAAQDLHINAPRPGRLTNFLRKKLNSYVAFNPLYRPDMYERLLEIRGKLRGVEFGFTRPRHGLDYDDAGMFGTFFPSVLRSKMPSLRIAFGMGKYGPRDRYLDHETEESVYRIAERAVDILDKLIVTGKNPRTNRSEEINLLGERLHRNLEISPNPQIPSLPDEVKMYEAIGRVYQEFLDEGLLERAAEAQLMRSS